MTCLQQFVHQYDNAPQHKAELECEEDFVSLNAIILIAHNLALKDSFKNNTLMQNLTKSNLSSEGR